MVQKYTIFTNSYGSILSVLRWNLFYYSFVMKDILVLVFSNLKHDARVTRQVNFLRKENRVTVVCFDANEIPGVTIIRINQTKLTLLRKALLGLSLISRQYGLAYKLFHNYGFIAEQLSNQSFDLIVANDIDALPLAFSLKKQAKIIFDAHEYAPRHFENNKIWKTFFQPFYIHLCKKYISKTDGMLTVGKGLANEYEKNFGIKPVVITNATRYHDIKPSPLEPGKIRLIHHGIANASRRLDLIIDMMDHLDERYTLDMILMVSDYASTKTKQYVESLIERTSKNPRITILPHVTSDQVVGVINRYDVGVFLIPPINFNYANTLPNKLFEFIQARLAVAVGPTPEMAEIVRNYDLGIVSNDFTAQSLAAEFKKLTPDKIEHFKLQSGKAAADLCAEKNELLFNDLLKKIFNP